MLGISSAGQCHRLLQDPESVVERAPSTKHVKSSEMPHRSAIIPCSSCITVVPEAQSPREIDDSSCSKSAQSCSSRSEAVEVPGGGGARLDALDERTNLVGVSPSSSPLSRLVMQSRQKQLLNTHKFHCLAANHICQTVFGRVALGTCAVSRCLTSQASPELSGRHIDRLHPWSAGGRPRAAAGAAGGGDDRDRGQRR